MAKTHGGFRHRGTKPRSWHPVKVSNSYFSVVGGLCNKPHLVKTMEIETSGGPKHFVQVTRNQRWLVQCAAGTLAGKGTLKRIKALSRLRLALNTAVSAGEDVATAVADAVADDDPMNALDAVSDTTAHQSPKKKVKNLGRNYQKTRVANAVFSVKMPILPCEAGEEAAAAGTRCVDVMARGSNSLFIGVFDVEWLITYVAKELELGGVALVPPAGGGDAAPAAVAAGGRDFRVQWDFFAAREDPGWIAEILKGPLKGKTFKCRIANLDADKWARVAEAVSRAGAEPVPLEKASFQQKKDGALLYAEAYCARLMQEAETAASTGAEAAASTGQVAEVAASTGHGAEVAASTGQGAEVAASTGQGAEAAASTAEVAASMSLA